MNYRKGCQEIIPLLWDYQSGRLTSEQMEMVETHLQVCDSCKKEAAGYGAVARLIAEDKNQALPEFESTWSAVRMQIKPQSMLWSYVRLAGISVCAVVVLFVCILMLPDLPQQQQAVIMTKRTEPVVVPAKKPLIKVKEKQKPAVQQYKPVKTKTRTPRPKPDSSMMAKSYEKPETPQPVEAEPKSAPEPEEERYARVVAWNANPDGTVYESACTVYEDPVTGEHHVETTDNLGSEQESSLTVVTTSQPASIEE